MESTLKAVILVGGKGTRLRPLTFRTPKPLIPLVNRASLEFILDACVEGGIDEAILSTGYLPRHFEEAYPGGRFGPLRLRYVHETDPLDTAGGVKNAQAYLDDTFVVFNGDVLSGLNVSELVASHRMNQATATLYLKDVDDPRAFGLVPIDSERRVLDFLEKPATDEEVVTNLINAGRYVLEPSVLELIPPTGPYSFERSLFPSMLAAGERVFGYPSDAYWLDIGTPASYLQAHADILRGALSWRPEGIEIAPGVIAGTGCDVAPSAKLEGPIVIGDSVTIGPEVVVEGPVVIGPDVLVGRGSRIAGSVLQKGAKVGDGCEVEGSIIGPEAIVRDRVIVAEASIVGPGADVEEENELRRGIRVYPDVVVTRGSIRF
jgi:mannose-1-phosphate guanylyltransferase